MKDGTHGYWIFEAPTRRVLSRRWGAWIAFQWQDAQPKQAQREKFIGPLPETHRMTFQEARAEFDRMPVPTYEEMVAQTRRNREQLARMEKEKERSESP